MFEPLRLLALHGLLGELPPYQAILGMRDDGRPAMFDLRSGHLQILGASGVGKSELLRSALFSLCLHHLPTRLRCLGLDLDGRELAVMEGLPHRQRRLAIGAREGRRLLDRVAAEAARRAPHRFSGPRWVVTVDCGLEPLDLDRLLDRVAGRGIHFLFTGGPKLGRPDCASVWGEGTGRFVSSSGVAFQAACLPAADLNLAVRLLRLRARKSGGRQAREAVAPVGALRQVGVL